jgi:hypothetical protein
MNEARVGVGFLGYAFCRLENANRFVCEYSVKDADVCSVLLKEPLML